MTKIYRTRPNIFGKKIGMSQYFDKEGDAIPVTIIELGENIISDIKTPQKNGYAAVQIGTETKKEKKLNKPELGNLKKKKIPMLGTLKEFRIKSEDLDSYKIGEEVDYSKIINAGDHVDISGTSIGKGFQGMVKLYHKHRGARSHGSKSYRSPGSIGAHTFPARVLKGKKMPSRMGNEKVTVRNLKVIELDTKEKVLIVKGAVPGREGSLLTIKPSISKWNQ